MSSAITQGRDNRPIALVGFTGVGKSQTGRFLSSELKCSFIDTDSYIQNMTGRLVDDFFEKGKEDLFRRYERGVAQQLIQLENTVIALGGGAFIDDFTRKLFLARALVIHLYVPWDEYEKLLPELANSRPTLKYKSTQEVSELYSNRMPFYAQAHIQLTVFPANLSKTVDLCLEALAVETERPKEAFT